MKQETLDSLNLSKLDHLTKKIVQDQEKQTKGKYKHIAKMIDKDGIHYSVTEYVCPNGEMGFDIFFYKTVEEKENVKSVCYGFEANSRQVEWSELKEEIYG